MMATRECLGTGRKLVKSSIHRASDRVRAELDAEAGEPEDSGCKRNSIYSMTHGVPFQATARNVEYTHNGALQIKKHPHIRISKILITAGDWRMWTCGWT